MKTGTYLMRLQRLGGILETRGPLTEQEAQKVIKAHERTMQRVLAGEQDVGKDELDKLCQELGHC